MKTQRSDTEKMISLKKVKEKALMKLLDKMYTYETILSYCLKGRKNAENINPKFSEARNGKTMILSNCSSKKYVVIKNQNLSKNKKQMDY